MIALSSVDLFNLLRQKIGETEAKAVTEFIEVQITDKFETEKKYLATKEDIAIVRKEIAESKTDMIKWVFALFVTLALMIAGLYFKK